jgi:hypothetical protein
MCKLSWHNRFHPNVVKAFRLLLGQNEDLRVKTDRYGVMRPILNPD